MIFKEIKNLIYSPILLVLNEETLYPMSINNIPSKYDKYEVIGIRSLNAGSTNYEDAVVISLKEPLMVTEGLGNPYHNIKNKNISIECKEE